MTSVGGSLVALGTSNGRGDPDGRPGATYEELGVSAPGRAGGVDIGSAGVGEDGVGERAGPGVQDGIGCVVGCGYAGCGTAIGGAAG